MTSNAKRHHFIPACYLKHFAVPADRYEGKLHAFDRETGRSLPPMSPDGLAFERHLYRVDVPGEDPNLAEEAYEKLETLFAPVLADVVAHGVLPKDPAEMRKLLAFVATQATRTPRVRELQERFYSDTAMLLMRTVAADKGAFMTSLRQMGDDELSKMPDEEADELFDAVGEFVSAEGARVEFEQTPLIGDALAVAAEIEDVLVRRHWILGRAVDKDAHLITTDDPAHLQPTGAKRPANPLWSPGFGDSYTNVLVPLSPRLLLIGLPYEYSARARVRLSRREVAAINTDLALSARRWVYSRLATFVQIGEDGKVVHGPTEMIRRGIARAQSPRMGVGGSVGIGKT